MHDHLTEIISHKKREVLQLKKRIDSHPDSLIAKMISGDMRLEEKHPFRDALKARPISIIAEIKRKSPSKNHLADIIDPLVLAREYVSGGAAAVSVLTDHFGFNGSLGDLSLISRSIENLGCPVLRKDFIIDPIQIPESIVAGANAILLIVSVLKKKTPLLFKKAKEYGIEALVEVHDRDELDFALDMGADIIGINNRNLTTFEVNTDNASELVPYIPSSVVKVAESGIHDVEIAMKYAKEGFDALLIGEALVKAKDPSGLIQKLRQI